MISNLKIHQLGFVVKDIDNYLKNSFIQKIENRIYDPAQKAELVLIKSINDFYLELIQPKSDDSYTYNFLKNHEGGYHHTCYIIKSDKEINYYLNEKNLKQFLGPMPAILFNNKLVSFCINKNKEIIEFLHDY